ncbi:cytochrome P450, partial [Colletotrichum somersetense]
MAKFLASLVAAWVFARVLARRNYPQDASVTPGSPPPVLYSWIPYIGHIYHIATKGSNLYFSSLCAAQRSPIATIKLPGQDIHLLHPLDTASIKAFTSMRCLSLMSVFHVAVGPAMGLVPASEKFLTDPDTGIFKRELSKLFNGELRNLQNLKAYASQLNGEVEEHWTESGTGQDPAGRVRVGAWVFDLLSYSMGSVFWGRVGPFQKQDFRTHLRWVLEDLRNLIPWLIPSELVLARAYVRNKIDDAVREEAYGELGAQKTTLFGHLARIYESLEVPREGFTDCHLVAIMGLMSNVINLITRAFCNIVGDPELMKMIVAELDALAEDESPSSSSNLVIDVDRIRSSCPLLVATWYELLRTIGDAPVTRGVYEDALFAGKYQLKKGSIVMTPIHLHNFD